MANKKDSIPQKGDILCSYLIVLGVFNFFYNLLLALFVIWTLTDGALKMAPSLYSKSGTSVVLGVEYSYNQITVFVGDAIAILKRIYSNTGVIIVHTAEQPVTVSIVIGAVIS